MPKLKLPLCFLLCLVISNTSFANQKKVDPIHALVHRIVPAYDGRLIFEKIYTDNENDVFELESAGDKIIIRGNNYNSMAVGLNHYLKYYCNTYVSWYKSDPIDLPVTMPLVKSKVRITSRVKNRFFLNYCTFGYTMPWWKWKDWERLIDWMSLNGINMPLSITGQEAIWYKVWSQFGLTDEQIREYFTGPAYLPWHRMANIDHWDGPLPYSWLNNQLELQKRIVYRERELNMTPVLPAFAGHVPFAIKTRFPGAKVTSLGSWGGFSGKYHSNFLDPFDPLFKKIQKSFLNEQTKVFGTDHLYGADPFNEVKPPSWEPDYLANASKIIFNSMAEVDPKATWLQMSWLFYIDREKWTKERIKSFITAVPQNKMMLLDYYCENTEVWKLTNSFFNQPYLWCYLGNFGGNTMLAGNLKEVESRMENAFVNGGDNLTGIGSTLEGFDVNPIMYDYIFEKVWSTGPVNVDNYVSHWAEMRGGNNNDNVKAAWLTLLKIAYTAPAQLGQGILINAKPSLTGNGNWTTNPQIPYKNSDLAMAWGQLLKVRNEGNTAYRYDVVNIGRQVLGNYFLALRDSFNMYYEKKNIVEMNRTSNAMVGLMDDLDQLLATQSSFLLGKWLQDARQMGAIASEKDYFEKDARSIITIWGGEQRSLNDYANRSWAGLTSGFYKKRWQLFFTEVISSVQRGKSFDEKTFRIKLNHFEDNWITMHDHFADRPIGNSFELSKKYYHKYASKIIIDTNN